MPDTDTRLHTPYKSRTRNPEATHDQEQIMERASEWFSYELLGPRGGAARRWLGHYGILEEDCPKYHCQIGYAPSLLDERIYEKCFHFMFHRFSEPERWQKAAFDIGLLTTNGATGRPTLRFQNRLIFTSYGFADRNNTVRYLQARVIDEQELPVYMTTTGIKQYPFWLPPNRVRFPGTCLVRSIKDVLVLSRHMIRSVVLRPSLDLTLLKNFPGPFFLLHPYNESFLHGQEETYRALVKQQLTLMSYCEELEKGYYPVSMPKGYEHLTDWLFQEGVNALFEKMATLLSQ